MTDPSSLLGLYRILDLTDHQGWLCGKILGDLGADVIQIEPPGGSAARANGPFFHDAPDPERSLAWLAFNTNKRGITLDIRSPTGRALFLALVDSADFVIESFRPGYLEQLGLGYERLAEVNPRLILVSITPYGQTGPRAQWRASDLEVMAAAGCVWLAGEEDRPPVRVSLPQSPLWAGMSGAMGALLAHTERTSSGRGQHVDVSAQASALWVLSHAWQYWDLNREEQRRAGTHLVGRSVTGARFRTIWPCKDGYLTWTIYGGAAGAHTNRQLIAWMDTVGMAPEHLKAVDWAKFNVTTATQEEVDQLEASFGRFFLILTKDEFRQGVLERSMLGYPVGDASDVLRDPQLEARGFWQAVRHDDLETDLVHPGAFAKFGAGACGIRRPGPRIGEHNEDIYVAELGLSREEVIVLKEARVI